MRRISLPELRRLGGARWTGGAAPALAQLPSIPTFQELRPALDGELRRSRRYERPLSLLVVVPAVDQPPPLNGNGVRLRNGSGNGNGHGADDGTANGGHGAPGDSEIADAVMRPLFWAQLRFLMLGSLLCGTLRESDVVSYAAELHQFVALLPECDRAAAHRTVDRLHQLYATRMGIGLRVGVAAYPADGLTLDDLLEHARAALAQAPIRHTLLNNKGNGAAHV
jgi:hypothetical protein